ncbi:hypothetical protein K490DRAFT_61859 [Saccharata proteae CBS 121410]|uniref:Uncharacterized protein n=1 Tax=Saccharata proteae CBS 121410 TaxID=1314787 RepID=A0A9P4I0J4_9PEZI|nr:hypothetical protein K490DRAFT_61859 [Saccharata proteae CBS 121410]
MAKLPIQHHGRLSMVTMPNARRVLKQWLTNSIQLIWRLFSRKFQDLRSTHRSATQDDLFPRADIALLIGFHIELHSCRNNLSSFVSNLDAVNGTALKDINSGKVIGLSRWLTIIIAPALNARGQVRRYTSIGVCDFSEAPSDKTLANLFSQGMCASRACVDRTFGTVLLDVAVAVVVVFCAAEVRQHVLITSALIANQHSSVIEVFGIARPGSPRPALMSLEPETMRSFQ